ncbi:MAG: hypothetical protein V1709_09285 [Planctomycetota bacterium]
MTKNKSIFIGLVLIILGIFIFIEYVYYSSTRSLKVSSHNPITDNQEAKTQKPPSHSDMATSPPLTKTTSSIIKQDYQPTETEKLFYRTVIESLKPKQIPKGYDDGKIRWYKETYKTFPPRKPYPAHSIMCLQAMLKQHSESPSENLREAIERYQEEIKQYYDSVSYSKQYYQEMIMNLQEIIKQYPGSSYTPHYQETLELIRQMQKKEEEFYDKYYVSGGVMTIPNLCYRDDQRWGSTIPLDEMINCYIYCLRYSYFYKTTQYKMYFGDGMYPYGVDSNAPMLSGVELVKIGIDAVPSLLNILEDRRPIIAVDDTDKLPVKFYRYQDAAVEILEHIAERPFPVQFAEDKYFSEYLSKQTPENKQKILTDIKAWVEESMKNPTIPEEQTPISNDKK